MKLSILLVTYNQAKYIPQCIEGILIQDIPYEFELIVADDFSDDATLKIIKEGLNGKIQNLKILGSTLNHGISKNYQRAFCECKGEYIAVIEGDDYWTDPERLVKHIDFLDKHQDCVLSMNRFRIYYQESEKFSNKEWGSSEDHQFITASQMAMGNKLGNLSACLFRKSEIDKIKPDLFDLELADWMLGMVLSENGLIAVLKEIMSVYRVHNNGQWSKMSAKNQIDKSLALIDQYNKYLGYRYDAEFNTNKKRLKESLMGRASDYNIFKMISLKIRKAYKGFRKGFFN